MTLFIAMNRFRIRNGAEAKFERIWAARDSHPRAVPGFVAFHLLRGAEAADHRLYASGRQLGPLLYLIPLGIR